MINGQCTVGTTIGTKSLQILEIVSDHFGACESFGAGAGAGAGNVE